MGKLETLIKSEIVRLARHELRAVCRPMGHDVHQLKRTVSQLRKTVKSLEKAASAYMAQMREEKSTLQAPEEEVKAARFSPKLVRSLRNRLGLSQAKLAALVGVNVVSVGFWEQGKTRPSGNNRAALVAIRKLKKREVREILKHKAAAAPEKIARAGRKPVRKAKRRVRRR